MKIVGLVAVRSGSIRVENKNIRPFFTSNILEIKLKQLKRISQLDEIYVNSNDEEMLRLARNCGCTAIKRDAYFASNEVPMREVYENMAQNCNGDVVVYANATNPLVKDKTISTAIEKFFTLSEHDSLNTAHPIKEFLFLDNKALNFQLHSFPRSQDLPNIMALNFAVSVIKRTDMIEQRHIIGKKPYIFPIETQEGTDIDEELDFEFAEYIYKKKQSSL